MDLLSDQQLESHLKNLIARERDLLHEILIHIREVDRRRLYLKRAYGSLFDYLTLVFGYSPACAQRRIDAVRLMAVIPEVLNQVQDGSLNLSQISLVQKAVRQKEKQSGMVISPDAKRAVLKQIERVAIRDAEKTVALALDLPVLDRTIARKQQDDSVRLQLTLSAEQWDKLNRCKELLSHKNAYGDLSGILDQVLEFYLMKKDPLRKTG